MKFTLGKHEKLKSKKLISRLFEEGNSVKKFPLKLIYLQAEHTSDFPAQVSFSVPKRNFKKAVERNRIKRLLREVYRKEKALVYNQLEKPYVFMITFIGKEEVPYSFLEDKITQLLALFIEQTKSNADENSTN